jgi:hypothetical protein
VRELNADVYGPPLFATAGIGLLLFLTGAVLLGRSITRLGPATKWIGRGFAGSLVAFVLGFLLLDILQPIAAALFALVGVLLALRLPRASASTQGRTVDALAGPSAPTA